MAEKPPDDPGGIDDDGLLGDDDAEELEFEEFVVQAIQDVIENGIPVGASLDDDAMSVLRSIADAQHKQAAATKENNRVLNEILLVLRGKQG